MDYKISKNLKYFFLTTLLLLSAGCTKNAENSDVRELKIYTWSGYFDDATIKEFEQENHVKVKADYLSSNEELLAKLQLSIKSNDEGYDLIIPSDYMVRNLIALQLLKPLDKSKLPFLKDFEPSALKFEYDPGVNYAVPMAIGTTGFAINTKLAPDIDVNNLSWKDIYENPKFEGKVALVDDVKEVLQSALIVHGKDLSSASTEDIKAAFTYLAQHKKNIRAFVNDTRPTIEAKECAVCATYSGDAITVAKNMPELKYALPKEGSTQWVDNMAIPKNGKNDDLAYAFMNKILSTKGAVRFTENIHYRTANMKAKALLPKETRENTIIFPTPEQTKKLHYIVERKDEMLDIDRAWTELKSR